MLHGADPRLVPGALERVGLLGVAGIPLAPFGSHRDTVEQLLQLAAVGTAPPASTPP